MLRIIAFLVVFASHPAWAEETKPKLPGFFYDVVRFFAPETAVEVWRGYDRPDLAGLLKQRGFKLGQPVHLRIYKTEGLLEVWLKRNERFELFEIYPICSRSGTVGPKQREGDKQAPEGFYEVNRRHLNPNSKYHLAINLGYPNAYDQANGRTGSALMIHGACASIGCYALTNENVEELYTLVESAFNTGQETVSVHAFPFKMTEDNLRFWQRNKWANFWVEDLLPAHQAFDITGIPPSMMTCQKNYQLMSGLPSGALPKNCQPIKAWQQ